MWGKSSLFANFWTKEGEEGEAGSGDLPQPQDPQLFERAGWRPPGTPAKASSPGKSSSHWPTGGGPTADPTADAPDSRRPATAPEGGAPSAAAASMNGFRGSEGSAATATPKPNFVSAPGVRTVTPGGGGSLFDRYANDAVLDESRARAVPNASTMTSRLRAQGLKMTCYLNRETNKSAAVAIAVPEHIASIKELIPLVQQQMKLDRRMLFAQTIFTPDGQRVRSFARLVELSQQDTPFIVGCGEPFDPFCVPPSMLMTHQAGGGRGAAVKIRREMANKGHKLAHLRADQIRAQGHGTNTSAARAAKVETVETNRQHAAQLRHEHMAHMLQCSADQERLVSRVRSVNEASRTERAARSNRLVNSKEEQIHDLAAQRRKSATARIFSVQSQAAEVAAQKAAHVREVAAVRELGKHEAKLKQVEATRARGAARRMSSATRSVKRAEIEEMEQKARKAMHDRARGHGSDADAQVHNLDPLANATAYQPFGSAAEERTPFGKAAPF